MTNGWKNTPPPNSPMGFSKGAGKYKIDRTEDVEYHVLCEQLAGHDWWRGNIATGYFEGRMKQIMANKWLKNHR